MYGYKAVLEATGRGGTYEKGVMPVIPRMHCCQRTRTGNWKGLTQTRRGRTLLHHIRTRVKQVGSSRNHTFYVQREMVRCVKTQTLFVQMSLSDVDSVRAWNILSMQMAVLSLSCYTQPLNNRIFIVHDYFFDNTSFCHANTNFTSQ